MYIFIFIFAAASLCLRAVTTPQRWMIRPTYFADSIVRYMRKAPTTTTTTPPPTTTTTNNNNNNNNTNTNTSNSNSNSNSNNKQLLECQPSAPKSCKYCEECSCKMLHIRWKCRFQLKNAAKSMENGQNMLQTVANTVENTMENERFELKTVAHTVEMAVFPAPKCCK